MVRPISMVYYWGGRPNAPTSKWHGILALLRQTIERGWVTRLVMGPRPEEELVAPFEQAGVEVIHHPPRGGSFDLACIRRTHRLLREARCDILHCDNINTSPLIAGLLAGVPVRVWHKLAMSPFYEQGVNLTGRHRLCVVNRVNAFCAHRVLVLNRCMREEWGNMGGRLSRTEFQWVPVPVAAIKTSSAEGIREGLGLAAEHFVMTTVGNAVPVKGWDVLLRAFARIAPGNPRTRLILVGEIDGPKADYFGQVEAYARQAGIVDKVIFTGIRSDIGSILKASDMFVLPSRSEGQPLALVEAMAAGLPCLGSAAGGIPEVLEDGRAGMLFERENVDDLAARFQMMMDDQALRNRLAAAALARADDFNIDGWAEAMIGHYLELLTAGRS